MAFTMTLMDGTEHEFPHAPECVGFVGVIRKRRNETIPNNLSEEERLMAEYSSQIGLIEALLNYKDKKHLAAEVAATKKARKEDPEAPAVEWDTEHMQAYDLLAANDVAEFTTKFMGGLHPKA